MAASLHDQPAPVTIYTIVLVLLFCVIWFYFEIRKGNSLYQYVC